MKTYHIASYPGDGIGPDVINEAIACLKKAAQKHGFAIDITHFPWSCEWSKEHDGAVVPDDFLDQLKPFDAIFLGAVGNPKIVPDHISLVPLVRMRQEFDQYVCLRPATLFPNVPTPLANKKPEDIDLVIVRENSEGEYIPAGGEFKLGKPEEVVIQTAVHSRKGVTRIIRQACELAMKRRKVLTMATKSNSLTHAMVFWDRILAEVSKDYPELKINKMHIDALSMALVRSPEKFDVIVGSNLFGDILSDLAAALVGSLGLTPSANINPERVFPSLFEPVHGSAPDIAGKGIANPIAAIRSAAMMMDFLGEKEAARSIEQAVIENLADGKIRTPDLGGTSTTHEVGQDILARI